MIKAQIYIQLRASPTSLSSIFPTQNRKVLQFTAFYFILYLKTAKDIYCLIQDSSGNVVRTRKRR